MDQASSLLLGRLIHGRSVAALATLHESLPSASMIPYAVWCDAAAGRLRFLTHVSRLSAHTRDMAASPGVCLLIMAEEGAGPDMSGTLPPQALPRVSIPAAASFIAPEHPDYGPFRRCYLERFPFAAEWFSLGDFSIVAFEPGPARFVAGFARAMTVSPAALVAAVCRGSGPSPLASPSGRGRPQAG